MKRTHEMPLAAGVALGLPLAPSDHRTMCQRIQQAVRPFVSSKVRASGARRHRQEHGLPVGHLAQQARQAGEQVTKVASAQYEQYLPKANEALSGVCAHARLNGKSAGSAG